MGKLSFYSGSGAWTKGIWVGEAGGAVSSPGPGGPRKLQQLGRVLGTRLPLPQEAAAAVLPARSAFASQGLFWLLKEPAHQPFRRARARARPGRRRGCVLGAGVWGRALGRRGRGGRNRKRSASWFQPRGANRAGLRRREELSVCSALLPPSPALLLPPLRRAVLAAGAAAAESRGGGASEPRAPSLHPSLYSSRALSPRPPGARPRESRAELKTAPWSTRGLRAPEGPCLTRARRASRTSR